MALNGLRQHQGLSGLACVAMFSMTQGAFQVRRDIMRDSPSRDSVSDKCPQCWRRLRAVSTAPLASTSWEPPNTGSIDFSYVLAGQIGNQLLIGSSPDAVGIMPFFAGLLSLEPFPEDPPREGRGDSIEVAPSGMTLWRECSRKHLCGAAAGAAWWNGPCGPSA